MHIKVLVDFPSKIVEFKSSCVGRGQLELARFFHIFFSSRISSRRGAGQKTASTSRPRYRRYHLFFTDFKMYSSFSYFSSLLTTCTWGATKGWYCSTHLLVVSALLASLELLWALVEHYRSQLEQIDGGSQKEASHWTGKDAEDPVCSRYCLLNCLQLHHLRMCHQSPAVAFAAQGHAVEDNTAQL